MSSTIPERLSVMRQEGWLVTLPHTDREIKLRAVEASALLADDKMPDLLTPLVIKSVYTDLKGKDVEEYLDKERTEKVDAIAFLNSINYICSLAIADNTKVEELILSEKRWVFRLVLGPADMLVTFRDNKKTDVGPVDAKQELPQVAQ